MGVPVEMSTYNSCTIARGSLNETGYYVTLARDLGYISAQEAQPLDARVATVDRLLSALIRSLMRKD
jgi:four helix bundle protein